MKKNLWSYNCGRGRFKVLLIKRVLVLLFFMGYLHASASIYSNRTKLKVNANKVSVTKVLKMIEEQSDFHFLYRSDLLQGMMVDEIDVKDSKLEEILDKIIVPKGFTYEIDERTVVIKKSDVNLRENVQQPQKRTIHGVVKDEKGRPIPGVSVMVIGTSLGQITDVEGNFALEVPADANSLEFSFVGMEKQRVSISGKAAFEIVMKEAVSGLEEVVVVGYGTQKKINLTGAVDVVSQEGLKNRPTAQIGQLLQGISPNLNISVTGLGGEPGAGNNFNVRGTGTLSGSNAALVLVDGVEMNISNLDPETIESVSVLKDAAASAIYGARAPFGVVLITTKRGTKNKGVSVSYTNNIAFSSPTYLPKWQSSLNYVTAYNEALKNTGLPDKFKAPQIERIKAYMAGTYTPEYDTINPPNSIWAGRHQGNANYDWFDDYFRDVTVNQKHNINVSGGDEKNQFYISTGFYDQGGSYNYAKEYYNRYNVLANFTSQPTSWLRLNVNTKYANSKASHPNVGGTTDDVNRTFVISEMIKFFPTTPKYNVNGTINNPYVNELLQAGPTKTNENDLFISLGTELEPIKGWKSNLNYSYNYTGNVFTSLETGIWVEIPTKQVLNMGYDPNRFTQNWSSNNYQSLNATTSYEKTYKEHFLKIMAGYEREYRYYSSIGGYKYSLITEEVPSFTTATGNSSLYDGMSHSATEAVFGRLNYNYKEKYLFEANARYNGSSKFAKDSRWGFFPSVSLGYNISREDFWKPISHYINNFKLRGSYGSLGNQNVANYLYLSNIPISTNLNWIIDNKRPLYSSIPGIKSPTLTWETITMANIGVDLGFLNNRLAIGGDLYERNTSNMFGPAMILPATLGATAPQENNASLSTKGWELSLEWKDRVNKDFSYSARFTLADNITTITKYLNTPGLINNWYVGKKVGEVWGYTTYGLIQTTEEAASMPDQSYLYSTWTPGDVRYVDLNNDGKINDGKGTLDDHGDLSVIANTSPRYTVGISTNVTWKNFDFSMFWQGILKRDLVPNGNLFWGIGTRGDSGGAYYEGGHEDYWRPADETNILGPNTDAYFPKPYISFSAMTSKNQQTQTRYILNASYIRLQNIQLGYTVPQFITQKIKVQALKMYVSGENLLTFDKLPPYINPETAYSSNRMTGAIYPISKSVSIGLNITF